MRPRARAAYGAALLYVLTTATAHACPVAADLDGAGVRFVGANGEDEIHRRLDAARVQIDFVIAGTIGSSLSIMIHGVYLQWLGGINADGSVGDGAVTWLVRTMPPDEMPVPTAGLTWEAAHTVSGTEPTMEEQLVSDAGGSAPLEEVATITVGAPETWTLGTCPYAALPVS